MNECSADGLRAFRAISGGDVKLSEFGDIRLWDDRVAEERGFRAEGKAISNLGYEELDQYGNKKWWVKLRRYRGVGDVLILVAPNLSLAVNDELLKPVGYSRLSGFFDRVNDKLLKGRGEWRIGRLDFNLDLKLNPSGTIWEVRDNYTMPRWKKQMFSSRADTEDGRSETVYFYTGKYKNTTQTLEHYHKGIQVRTVYPEYDLSGLDLDNRLRVEDKFIGAGVVKRKLGVQTLEDIKKLNFAKVIYSDYKKLKLKRGDIVRLQSFLEAIFLEYSSSGRVFMDRAMNRFIIQNSDMLEKLLEGADKDGFIAYFRSRGVPYLNAYRWWTALEDRVREGRQVERAEVKPQYVSYIGNRLGALAGVA